MTFHFGAIEEVQEHLLTISAEADHVLRAVARQGTNAAQVLRQRFAAIPAVAEKDQLVDGFAPGGQGAFPGLTGGF